ncbi:hypothetical protein [Exiguobacterium undae]|uniref:Uncharacterized protein n=1 Tax=Exiguobacterium undae TaxID=169177 RepID=A0ABX2V642_9BACL|nr:hypothetical protein [Exiguobacterium undae]OAN10695.1 hypothetical protein A3783_12760 [Exiguobacterium undae]
MLSKKNELAGKTTEFFMKQVPSLVKMLHDNLISEEDFKNQSVKMKLAHQLTETTMKHFLPSSLKTESQALTDLLMKVRFNKKTTIDESTNI